jgi:acetylglutamate kinase
VKLLVKIGGSLVDDARLRTSVAAQIAVLSQAGNFIVIVHGGGRQLTRYLADQGIASHFVNGLRVTGDEAMDAVVKVLAGTVNKELVGALRAQGVNAVGLSGIDGHLTTAVQMSEELGRVGRVTRVDAALLEVLTLSGYLPVIACVAGDDQGLAWNINADQMAAACAQAFGADRLIFLTDVAGVLDESGAVLLRLNVEQVRNLIASGVAKGGMQAKLDSAAMAITGGVPSVTIAAGADLNILQRLINAGRCGTEITRN